MTFIFKCFLFSLHLCKYNCFYTKHLHPVFHTHLVFSFLLIQLASLNSVFMSFSMEFQFGSEVQIYRPLHLPKKFNANQHICYGIYQSGFCLTISCPSYRLPLSPCLQAKGTALQFLKHIKLFNSNRFHILFFLGHSLFLLFAQIVFLWFSGRFFFPRSYSLPENMQ